MHKYININNWVRAELISEKRRFFNLYRGLRRLPRLRRGLPSAPPSTPYNDANKDTNTKPSGIDEMR